MRHLKKTEKSVKKGKFRQFREKKKKRSCESNPTKRKKSPYLEGKNKITVQIARFRPLSLVVVVVVVVVVCGEIKAGFGFVAKFG